MSLQVNHVLKVQLGGTSSGASLNCIVTAVTPERVILRVLDVTVPPIGIEPGASVVLSLCNEQGVHSATGQVVQVATKPHVAISLRAPIKLATKQTRRFVRVAVKLPVICCVRAAANQALVGTTDEAATALDLSAGCMRLSTALTIANGDELALTVKLASARTKARELQLVGRVLRVAPGETKPRGTLIVGIELIHANQREQDALVMVVFELERKRLV
jgi:c-di-GMP-binding flagellar brake protein YcgR